MTKYYRGADGRLYRHKISHGTESHNFLPGMDLETLTPITEEEYNKELEIAQNRQRERLSAAVTLYHEQQLSAAKQAYTELIALGLSEPLARSVSKYRGQ